MKIVSALRLAVTGIACLFLLPSCLVTTMPSMPEAVAYEHLESSYYPQTYRSAPVGYRSYPSYPSYRSYPSYGSVHRPAICSRCSYNPCRCSSHRSHSSRGTVHIGHKAEDHNFKIVGGSTGSKKRPTGHHPLSWYKERGYDISKLNLKNKLGERIDKGKKKN